MREINRDGVKLSQLRAFVAVAGHGNFSEAALHLNISQSAVSHAIATLEEELGVVLLSRGRHGATLTSVGVRVLTHAQQMLHLLESIGKEANLVRGLQGGEIRISSFRSVATHVLPEIIAQFRRRFPEIAVTLEEYRGDNGVEQAVREGRADVGFICMPTPSGFEAWEVLRDEYVALLPPKAEVPDATLTWEHLSTYPLILPPDNDYCSQIIYGHLTKLRLSLNATYKIKEDSTIVSMVMQGLGATIMARLAAEPLPREVQVFRLPVPLERVVRVVTLADALHSPAVFAFLDTLKQMGQGGEWRSPWALQTPPGQFIGALHNENMKLG
jgi:DNA-binding transcriptional LysR family regulator